MRMVGGAQDVCIQLRMGQLPTTNAGRSNSQCNTGRSKYTPRPSEPSGQIRCKICKPPRCELICPKILAARIRICACQLGQRDSHARGDQRDQNDAIDDENGPSRIDPCDESGRDAEPGVCKGEAHAQNREDGVIAPHILLVAHLRQICLVEIGALQSIYIFIRNGGTDSYVILCL